jgi:hypothetical protein
MAESIKTVTWLFRLAIEWYKDHPGQQIPHALWDEHTLASKKNEDKKVIYFREHAVKKFDYDMIPALAAIALGAPPEQLLAVLKHHANTVYQIHDFTFQSWCETMLPSEPGDDQLLIPNAWNVLKALVDAMSLDTKMTDVLEGELQHYQDNDELEVACLLSESQILWQKTHLSAHFDRRKSGNVDLVECPRLISADTLKEVEVNFNDLSDEQVLSILDRSGNLLPDVDAENGFKSIETVGFFRKLFCDGDNRGNYNRIIEAMNRAEDPVMIAAIADRMLTAIPDFEKGDRVEGVVLLETIRRDLDQTRYGHVLESMVLKLCVLPIYYMANVKNDQFEKNKSRIEREFHASGSKIFKLLNDELKDLAPSAWRKRHFDAIGTLMSEWNVPQDLTGFDLHGLLIETLTALEIYKATDHLDYLNEKMDWCAEEAEGHVKKLIRFVSKEIDIEYDRLEGLSSGSKALLASQGFDPRKLPGINNRDKGALLSEGLGL